MPTILRLEALSLSRKTYELNDAALADLAIIQGDSTMSQTAAIHVALRNTAEMKKRALPLYHSAQPEEPEPPTSAPSAARVRPLQVVEKTHQGAARPPRRRPANTKRRKK